MTTISQKCQYALRAIFELAKKGPQRSVTVTEIAAAQAIPGRFLEVIMGQLKQGGFVESQRGAQGGYVLTSTPGDLTIGEIIRFIEGSVAPVKCVAGSGQSDCPLKGRCSFVSMWAKARDAVTAVYDSTTFQDLIDEEKTASEKYISNYCI